jgi:hypothetical protein
MVPPAGIGSSWEIKIPRAKQAASGTAADGKEPDLLPLPRGTPSLGGPASWRVQGGPYLAETQFDGSC